MSQQEICERRYIRKSRLIEAVSEILVITGLAVAFSALALWTRDPVLSFIAGFSWALTLATWLYWVTR